MYGLKLTYFQVLTTAVLVCVRGGVLYAPLCLTGDFAYQLRRILHGQAMSSQETADMVTQVMDDVTRTLNQRWQVLTTAVLVCVRGGVLQAPLCLTGDFASQLRRILHGQTMSSQESADMVTQVLDDVTRTLNQRWQGYEVFLCGSLSTGLGMKSSDVDLAVQLPTFNSSAGLYVLQETEKLFKKQPTLYSKLKYRNNVVYISSFFSFLHIPTQRTVEIEYHTGDISVENSKLVRYYFNLDKRFLPLGGFLKFWFKIHGLTGRGLRTETLPNYGLYLLIIFYLQQKNMAPPGYVLQVDSNSHITSNNWDMGFTELTYRSENTDSLHELFGGFFKYYSEFNFERNIVSPFTGRPIPRNAFIDIDHFPKEYTLNNNTSARATQFNMTRNGLNISTAVCIQDVFVHDSNVAKRLSHELATKFKYLLKSVAAMFKDLPSDSVLRAILGLSQRNCY